MANTNKITVAMKKYLVSVGIDGEDAKGSLEMVYACVNAGLVAYRLGGSPSLTPEGKEIADEYARKVYKQRHDRNATQRARNDAMRSLGLKKVAHGWE